MDKTGQQARTMQGKEKKREGIPMQGKEREEKGGEGKQRVKMV